MKILAIMGSPKGKGSGYKVVKMIENRMIAEGDVEFEYLFSEECKPQAMHRLLYLYDKRRGQMSS